MLHKSFDGIQVRVANRELLKPLAMTEFPANFRYWISIHPDTTNLNSPLRLQYSLRAHPTTHRVYTSTTDYTPLSFSVISSEP